MRPDPWFLRISVQVYGLLVWLYPRAFRRGYGDSMIRLFHDASRDAYRESGGIGFFGYVVASSAEYVQSVAREHWESIMVNEFRFKQWVMPACWMALAACSSGLWIASSHDSIGLFSLPRDTSLRFSQGVMEFRHIYARSIEAPIPGEEFHETAMRRGWFIPPEPTIPGFGYSSGHVIGLGGTATDGTLLATVTPAEYALLRVPLWAFLIPFIAWSVLILKRQMTNIVIARRCRLGVTPAASPGDLSPW